MSRSHLRFQILAVATLLVGLLPATFGLAIEDPVQLAGAYFGWCVAMYLFGTGGTLVAATTFSPGEPQRPGWLLLAASFFVLVPATVVNGPKGSGLYEGGLRIPSVVLGSNVAWSLLAITALILLSRAWRSSGLDVTSRGVRVVARLVALALALALAGPDLVERFPAAVAGDPLAVGDVLTDVLDGALFVVAVPVLRAALSLGGGLVSWPWAMLTLSIAAWLGYDAVAIYGEAAGLTPRTVRAVEEVFRTLAASLAFSAGVSQRWVMTEREAHREEELAA